VSGPGATRTERRREPLPRRRPVPGPVDHRPFAPQAPMLATPGPLAVGEPDEWAYEFKWDGVRGLLRVVDGTPTLTSRVGRDLTPSVPELLPLARALAPHPVLLDGELVVVDDAGVPAFSHVLRRVTGAEPSARDRARYPVSFVAFDLLHLDGRSLLSLPYDERRWLLEDVLPEGDAWAPTPSFTGQVGPDVFRGAAAMGIEGVVAKRRSSPYLPGRRSPDWVKTKHEHTQEVVVGGWTPGSGHLRGTFGALVLGIPRTPGRAGPLAYVGKVGTGFDAPARRALSEVLRRNGSTDPPFDPPPPASVSRNARWVEPTVVGEVRFLEWTGDHRLRHPVWRGIREDRAPEEIARES
jgi:bifunctional non-homologous end joining protein LigD